MALKMNTPKGIVSIHPSKLHPNNYNPNVMDDAKFEMLVEDIGNEELLDQPIVVRPHPEIEGEFIIVDGEHRWRVASGHGFSEVPIVVKDWSENEAKMHTVRRNIVHGVMDKGKFSSLMRSLQDSTGMETSEIRKRMGFASEKELARIYRVAKIDRVSMPKYENEEEKQKKLAKSVQNVSTIVRSIIEEYGDSVTNGIFMFTHSGKPVLSFAVSKQTRPLLEQLGDFCDEDLTPDEAQTMMHNILEAMVEGVANGS
ncbi:nucleoid occlusion protein [Vibrio phage vB_VpS_PG28]|nr:nucleoid occlusion protein [Vibrio phage vB_VpS_PG28]